MNNIANNEISGVDAALSLDGGVGYPTYPNVISDNNLMSDTATLLHNQSSLNTYIGNNFYNTSGVYLAPTISAGNPAILSVNAAHQLQMVSGAMVYPANSLIVAGGGGTGIVSVGAADSAGTGYRTLRIPN